MHPQQRLPMERLPKEMFVEIFRLATVVPYEFDATGDDLEAARTHLLGLGTTPSVLKKAIQMRLTISLISREWKDEWAKYLFQSVVISRESHLQQIEVALKNIRWLKDRIRRIDVDGMRFTARIRDLCSSTPNLQTLRIDSARSVRFTIPPNLVCLSLAVERHMPITNAYTLQIIDLSGLCYTAHLQRDYRDVPELPHLYAVGVELGQWDWFDNFWRANRERIRILSIKWIYDKEDPDGNQELWETITFGASHPDGRFPNLTHLITSLMPPPDIIVPFPSLRTIEIHRFESSDFNPYGEGLWTWKRHLPDILITNVPLKGAKEGTDEWFVEQQYHCNLQAFMILHLSRGPAEWSFSPKFFDSNGNAISYTHLITKWQSLMHVPDWVVGALYCLME